MEVKRVIKYQKAIKTRRRINLPPSSLMCDVAFISSSLSSFLTLCVRVSDIKRFYLWMCLCVRAVIPECMLTYVCLCVRVSGLR